MKLTILCLFTVFVTVFAGTPQKTTVSGRVVGYDGKPMQLAHVHFTPAGLNSKKSFSYQVKPDGTYSVEIPNGWYFIYYTGVSHTSAPKLPNRIYCCGEPVTINAHLEGITKPTTIDSIQVVTQLSKYSFDDAITLQRQSDGTFTTEIKTNTKELRYQILIHSKPDQENSSPLHSINGTANERFEYDSAGDYRSVAVVNNGKAKIVFNPSLLPKSKSEVSIETLDVFTKSILELAELEKKDNVAFNQVMMKRREGKQTDYNPRTVRNYYRTLADKTSNPNLKQCYQVAYCKVKNFQGDSTGADPTYVTTILENIPPSSPVWESSPLTVFSAVRMSSDTNSNYPERVLQENQSRYVQSELLYQFIQRAATAKNENKLREYYSNLTKNFPEMYAAKRAEKEYNPDKRMIVGKTIPNFLFQGIEEQNGIVITPATLKGKWVLIDNWATWCGPCVSEMSALHKTFEKFKDKNFTILSVSYDRKATDVTKFRNGKWKMPWLHCFSEGVWENEAARIFEVSGIPKPILIDPNGKIIALENELRGELLEQTIGKYIQ